MVHKRGHLKRKNERKVCPGAARVDSSLATISSGNAAQAFAGLLSPGLLGLLRIFLSPSLSAKIITTPTTTSRSAESWYANVSPAHFDTCGQNSTATAVPRNSTACSTPCAIAPPYFEAIQGID